jgi:enterochelin esterase-like enzyme
MYDSIVPLVREHLACAGPGAKVAFTGHSLGGSLATVLTLLMVYR